MERLVLAAAIWVAVLGVGAAVAAPGQCSVTGYGSFACDVAVDGGGLAFELPDGQMFAFTLVEEGVGMAYRIDADARPGERPTELRALIAVDGKPGCWARDEDFEFCVLVEQ